jgi:hypothetical protein
MSIRIALAAAALAATSIAAVPALAMERVATPRHAIGFYFGAQSQQAVTGGAATRVGPEANRAQAAATQNFFPVDTTIRSNTR